MKTIPSIIPTPSITPCGSGSNRRHRHDRHHRHPWMHLSPWLLSSLFILLSYWQVLPLFAIQIDHTIQTNYRLGAGDRLKIFVENEPELYLDSKISAQGTIEFALLGTIHAAHLTAAELQETLRTKLLDGYLLNPVVQVTVAKYQSYHIHGEIKKVGKYPYQQGMTIQQAIERAEGFSQFANRKKITLVRKQNHRQMPIGNSTAPRFIESGLFASQLVSQDEQIRPGDIINISMLAKQQESLGSLQASYHLGPGDSIKVRVDNEPSMDLETKISAQGSINLPFVGEIKIANLTVKKAEERVRNYLLEGFLLNPNVFINVVEYRVYYMHGEVNKSGGYPFKPGLTVRKAIALAEGFTEFADKSDILVIHDNDPLFKEQNIGLNDPVLPGDVINVTASFW